MEDGVKSGERQAARRADTEARIVRAATELFVRHGYTATTLARIADQAGVAPRTVYVRFDTKAAVLVRAIGVALVGDTATVPVRQRDWFAASLTAPGVTRRVTEFVRGGRGLFERAGGLLVVAAEAEPVEQAVAAAAQAGREDTHRNVTQFWATMRDDRLLRVTAAELRWLADTATLLSSADTYVQTTRLYGWDIDTYARWLRTSLLRLAAPYRTDDG